MILPVTEVDTIKHVQKAQNSHISAFESIFEQLDRQDREKRIKREKEHKRLEDKKKAAILQKQRTEARKREAAARAKEQERLAEESKRQSELKRDAVAEQPVSGVTPENGRPESAVQVQSSDTQVPTSGIGATWAEISPQQAAAYMASKTGVSAARWEAIIYAESTNNPTVVNSIGCFGYLQLHPVHGAVSQMTPQQYLDTAVSVFASQGIGAWEVTLKGMA